MTKGVICCIYPGLYDPRDGKKGGHICQRERHCFTTGTFWGELGPFPFLVVKGKYMTQTNKLYTRVGCVHTNVLYLGNVFSYIFKVGTITPIKGQVKDGVCGHRGRNFFTMFSVFVTTFPGRFCSFRFAPGVRGGQFWLCFRYNGVFCCLSDETGTSSQIHTSSFVVPHGTRI